MKMWLPLAMWLVLGCGTQEAPVDSTEQGSSRGIDVCVEHGGECTPESSCAPDDTRPDMRCRAGQVCCMGDIVTPPPPPDDSACLNQGGECISKSECPVTIRHPELPCTGRNVCCIWLP